MMHTMGENNGSAKPMGETMQTLLRGERFSVLGEGCFPLFEFQNHMPLNRDKHIFFFLGISIKVISNILDEKKGHLL